MKLFADSRNLTPFTVNVIRIRKCAVLLGKIQNTRNAWSYLTNTVPPKWMDGWM